MSTDKRKVSAAALAAAALSLDNEEAALVVVLVVVSCVGVLLGTFLVPVLVVIVLSSCGDRRLGGKLLFVPVACTVLRSKSTTSPGKKSEVAHLRNSVFAAAAAAVFAAVDFSAFVLDLVVLFASEDGVESASRGPGQPKLDGKGAPC